ncbi:MAG: tetratricopeptide repeat protein [Fimbriimonadaceae bacterium]
MANEQAKAFVDQATQSLQNSQFQQALDLVDQAIAIEPGASDSHVLRGICLSQLGQPDAATEALRKAIMLSPYNAKAYYNLAVHYNALGNKKEACELAREAVGVDPRHAAAKQFLTQLEAELSGPPSGPTGVGEESSSMYDPTSVQPPAPVRTGSQDLASQSAGRTGAHDLPPLAGQSDMPHVSPAPGQPRTTAESAPPPSVNAGSRSVGGQFSPAGYTRPGYEQPASSLPWVSNMGGAWIAIGIVIAVLPLICWFINLGLVMAALNSRSTDFQQMGAGASGAFWVVYLLSVPLSVLWMLCDTLDRRSGFWWIALAVPGACCCLNFIVMPIYMAAGRKPR